MTNSNDPRTYTIKSEYGGRSRKNLDFHSSHEVGMCAKSPRHNKSDTNFHEIWIFFIFPKNKRRFEAAAECCHRESRYQQSKNGSLSDHFRALFYNNREVRTAALQL